MAILKQLMPYPDPGQRRAARKAARRLIDCVPSPDLAPSPTEIAELALLRLLWLQRLSHSRFPQAVDVDALVARASVETLITGLYWLHADDAQASGARGDTARAFRRLMDPFADEEFLPKKLIEGMAETLGPKASPPSLLEMARAVSLATGSSGAEDIYERLYRPLSILVAHPSVMGLLRHTRADRVDERPDRVWSTRAARHTADACMAYLAIELCEKRQLESVLLREYFEAHIQRANPPMATILGRWAIRQLRPRRIGRIIKPTARLWRYYRSGRAAVDTYPLRRAKTHLAFEEMFDAFGVSLSGDGAAVIDHFVDELSGGPDMQGPMKMPTDS
ncbi:MAG: hypothetical protein JST53_09125 [Actinobacteria bacterium]|nr:hypothetical protein [Actinomycetota bacterium]